MLAEGGRLLLEIGEGQAGPVTAILSAAGFEIEAVRPDVAGRPRAAVARAAPRRPLT